MSSILIIGALTTTHIRRLVGKLGATKSKSESIYVLDTAFRVDYQFPDVEGVERIVGLKSNKFFRFLSRIPKTRVFVYYFLIVRQFKALLSAEPFSLVSIVGITGLSSSLIRIAHRKRVKTHIVPLGSDVLRASRFVAHRINNAFKETDFVSVSKRSDFGLELIRRYSIPSEKMIAAGFGSDVIDQIDCMRGTLSRKEMASMLNLPESSFYIACGYNANKEQNHEEMLNAIAANQDLLPDDYCVIVQLSYGISKQELIEHLSNLAKTLKLKVFLITDFLSLEQVTALRFVTDLFIHVQKTDATNASILEYLLADTQVINGEWLKYRFIEQEGKPYYTCSSLDQLSTCLRRVLLARNNFSPVPESTKQIIRDFKSWQRILNNWHALFRS